MCQGVPVPVEKTPGPAGSTSDVVACFEAMPAIVWAFEGADLVVTAANAPARASAGNRVGIVGRPIRQVLPELEGQQIFEMMEEAYRAGRVISAVDRRVLVDRNGDGRLEEGFFTYTFVPTFDPEGSVRGLVAHIVETTAQAVRSAAAERAAAASQLRLQEASQVVLELQRSLLPADVPVLPWLTVAGQYRVAGDELAAGGDWFDTVVLPDERVVLVVGDVVGHGARAAGAMGQLRAVLLEALTGGLDPAEALRRVDRFAAREGATRATTVCLVVVNPAGEAMVATRAHPLPLVVDPLGGTRRMPAVKSTPLGIGGPDAEWLPLQLGVGEMLLLFSDGLMERPDRSTGHAMDALAATVAATRRDIGEDGVQPDTSLPTAGVERLATLVVERMAFLGDGYADDVTVLVAERRDPVPGRTIELDATVRAEPVVRNALTDWLEGLGAGEDDIDALVYAVGEAVANTVQHAYADRPPEAPRPVRVRAGLSASGTATVEVTDHGRWLPARPGGSGGRGLLMMRELCDTVVIDGPQVVHDPAGSVIAAGAAPGSTTVRLTHRLRRPVMIGQPAPGPARPPRVTELAVDVDDEAGRVTLRGPIDLSTVEKLRPALLHTARGGIRALTVDLTAVNILSSAGVQLLHDLAALVPGLRFVVPVGRPAHDVLRLVGLDDLILPADHPARTG